MNQICIQWPLYSSLVRPCQRHSSRVWVCKEGHMPPPFLKAEFLSWQEKMFGWARGLRMSLEVKIPLFFFLFFLYLFASILKACSPILVLSWSLPLPHFPVHYYISACHSPYMRHIFTSCPRSKLCTYVIQYNHLVLDMKEQEQA